MLNDDEDVDHETAYLLKTPPLDDDISTTDNTYHKNMKEFEKNQPIKGLIIIMLAQVCISFSYLSLRSLVAIFLNEFGFEENDSAFVTNAFVSAYFLFAILGGILADMKVGRVPAIICGCILSTIGYYFEYISISYKNYDNNSDNNYREDNIEFNKEFFFFGLLLISMGGITIPNISTLVGDQWIKHYHLYSVEDMQNLIGRSFRFYYMSINFGAIIGMIWLPTLNYFDAFFAISVVSAFSCIIFIIASYKNSFIIVELKGNANLIQTINENREVLRHLLIILAPLPLFWALFYNIPSLWTFSAEHMNRHVFNKEISASSVQALNPILNLLLIPLFDFIIYPYMNQRKQVGPIQRMVVGMTFTSLSLFCASYLASESSQHAERQLHVCWMLPQYILLSCGEILLSITCLEYAYAYSPDNCKSLVMSLSFFTRSLGNLAVALIDLLHIGTPAEDYFFFGLCMFLSTIFYARYTKAWSIEEDSS